MIGESARPGFQGSQTTGCEVRIYSHRDDPVLPKKQGGVWEFRGRTTRDTEPAVVGFQTGKTLRGMGTFSLTVKVPRAPAGAPDFYDTLVDDDWIDIVGIVNGKRFHVLRGIIDTFREDVATSGGGATTRTVTITGFDFAKVFDKTLIWWNQFRAENAGFTKTLDVLGALHVAGNPAECVERLLYGFMETLATADPPRANWLLPPSVPGTAENQTFPETVVYAKDGFTDTPSRQAVSQQFMDPSGVGIWNLATEWSDPMFCELIADLATRTTSVEQSRILAFDGDLTDSVRVRQIEPGEETTPLTTTMAVMFRDVPFPNTRDMEDSAYFKLPLAVLAPQDVVSRNLGRGGTERFNAFFVSPQALQQMSAQRMDLAGPLWDPDDIKRHGMRPFTVDSRYIADEADLATMSSEQRLLARDFHCLNPYLFNGTLGLGVWRPDIRAGTRVRIRGASPEEDFTFYVEEVQHTWSPTRARTSLGVTRGWKGTDTDYLKALWKVAFNYRILPGNDKEPEEPPGFATT